MSHLQIPKCDMPPGIGARTMGGYLNEENDMLNVPVRVPGQEEGSHVLAQVQEETAKGDRRDGPCHLGNGEAAEPLSV